MQTTEVPGLATDRLVHCFDIMKSNSLAHNGAVLLNFYLLISPEVTSSDSPHVTFTLRLYSHFEPPPNLNF